MRIFAGPPGRAAGPRVAVCAGPRRRAAVPHLRRAGRPRAAVQPGARRLALERLPPGRLRAGLVAPGGTGRRAARHHGAHHAGLASRSSSTSPRRYPDGGRNAWASTVGVPDIGTIVKLDVATGQTIDTYSLPADEGRGPAGFGSISGAYNLLDRDNHLIVGRAQGLEVYARLGPRRPALADRPAQALHASGASAVPVDRRDRRHQHARPTAKSRSPRRTASSA